MSDDRHADRIEGEQLAELIEEATAALDLLAHGRTATPKMAAVIPAATLLARSRQPSRDGYASSSRGGGSGPSSVKDDENMPMPPLADPVGELVVAAPTADPIRQAANTVLRKLTHAVDDLRKATGALAGASPSTRPAGEPGCSSHERIGIWEPVEKGGRCWWCYDWQAVHGEDPDVRILQARAEGRRITTKLVDEVIGARHSKRHRRPSRRR